MTTTKILLMNDLHIFGPLQMMTLRELVERIVQSDIPVLLNGDVIDVKNVERSRVREALNAVTFLSRLSNVTFVGDNHEMDVTDLQQSHVISTTYFNHSDMISNPERYGKFRQGKPGASWLKRNLITPLVDFGRHLHEVRPNELIIKFVESLPDYITNCEFGHAHPDELITFKVKNKTCRIWPRGIREIEV